MLHTARAYFKRKGVTGEQCFLVGVLINLPAY